MPDTDTQGVALEPCPFCGNDGSGPIEDALQVHHNEPFEWNDRHTWTVQCDKCTATMGYSDSEEEAIAAWNRRAYLSAAQEGREAAGRGPEKVEGGYLYKWVDADGEPHQFVHPSPYLVAATPAPAQPAARVVVKGLEWVEQAGNWIANVGFGTYWVDYDNGRWEWGFRLKFSPGNSTAVASEIEAKAAAQADYEKRISPHLASPTDADAVAPEGYALVPIKPTEAMISEGDRVMYGRYGCSFEVAPIYEAMLTAAKAGEDG